MNVFLPLITAFAYSYYLYIAFMSNRIIIYLVAPFALYCAWLILSGLIVGASIGIGIFYYYILIFKQINQQINLIKKKSKLFVTIRFRRILMRLIEQHNLIANQIITLNLVIRRTISVFFIVFAIFLIIPLNVYIK